MGCSPLSSCEGVYTYGYAISYSLLKEQTPVRRPSIKPVPQPVDQPAREHKGQGKKRSGRPKPLEPRKEAAPGSDMHREEHGNVDEGHQATRQCPRGRAAKPVEVHAQASRRQRGCRHEREDEDQMPEAGLRHKGQQRPEVSFAPFVPVGDQQEASQGSQERCEAAREEPSPSRHAGITPAQSMGPAPGADYRPRQ